MKPGQGFDPPQLHQCFCGVGEFLFGPVFVRGRLGCRQNWQS
jgi:hypothetical protein